MTTNMFVFLVLGGFLMLAAEIFLPGGILGILGSIALFAAIVAGFTLFGPLHGAYIAVGIIVFGGVGILLWIRLFPKTGMGRALTLSHDQSDCKAADSKLRELTGQIGTAATDLRPAGIALINGRKYNVISQGDLIDHATEVRVVKVDGNRIIVTHQTAVKQ